MGHYWSETRDVEKEQKDYLNILNKSRKYLHDVIDDWLNRTTQRKVKDSTLRFETEEKNGQLIVRAYEEKLVAENRFLMEPL